MANWKGALVCLDTVVNKVWGMYIWPAVLALIALLTTWATWCFGKLRQAPAPTGKGRDRFTVVKQLNTDAGHTGDNGNFNEGVFLVLENATGKHYVEKRISLEFLDFGFGWREQCAQEACRHPNIVRYVDSELEDCECGYGSIYMEICEEGTLEDLISRYGESGKDIPEDIICEDLAQSDAQAERKPGWDVILHRDLKPSNCFLTLDGAPKEGHGRVLLGNFGASLMQSHVDNGRVGPGVQCLTRIFSAPEVNRDYLATTASDIYSLGLIMHCMIFKLRTPIEFCFSLDHWGYSQNLSNLIRECLNPEPSERPDIVGLAKRVYMEKEQYELSQGSSKKVVGL